MSVWFCVPSARPAAEAARVLDIWRRHGYKIALWRDDPTPEDLETLGADLISTGPYPGYARATNELIASAMIVDPAAEWFVIGGDDIEPHIGRQAEEIAEECSQHFCDHHWPKCWHWDARYPTPEAALAAGAKAEQKPQALWSATAAQQCSTYGVMQPVGDRWGENDLHLGKRGSAYIDRVAGSAWIGREFALRINGGRGVLHDGYTHMYVDEELQCVAEKLGVFWQRRDLIQLHRHWARERGNATDMPAHLKQWNSAEHWRESKALFDSRKAAGFPGHEVIS